MIRSFLRLFWPTTDPTPPPRQRAAEMSAAYAVATFVNTGRFPSLALGPQHRRDGLSGTRTSRMLAAQRASFDERPGAAAAELARVRRTLAVEIGSADRRDAKHLRVLEALATGLEALREAQRDDAPLDDAARERLAEQAAGAADALPDEPYLRHLQARTLHVLGRADEAAAVLNRFSGGAWLGGWQANFVAFRDYYRSADGHLPRGSRVERIRAMSAPGWLALAGSDLPDLLDVEAAGVPRVPVAAAQIVVLVSDKEFTEALAKALIGTKEDDETQATIGALRSVLHRRFGVVLPGVDLRTAALAPDKAVAYVDGELAATERDPVDLALVAAWWPGVAGATSALRTMLVAALRHLARFAPAAPAASREESEARASMLVDRMPTTALAAESSGGAVLQVATLRLDPATAKGLWGNTGGHAPTLLDATAEDDLLGTLVAEQGLAVPAALFNRLAGALRARVVVEPQPIALVVRDPLLRPLLRMLLQDDFPDLPVLALAEVAFDAGRRLGTLAVPSPDGGPS